MNPSKLEHGFRKIRAGIPCALPYGFYSRAIGDLSGFEKGLRVQVLRGFLKGISAGSKRVSGLLGGSESKVVSTLPQLRVVSKNMYSVVTPHT